MVESKKTKAKKQRVKTTKTFVLFFFLIILFTFFQTGVAAQQMPSICKDVSVAITIPDKLNESETYTKFVRITNNNDVPAFNDNLSLVVFFNITNLLIPNTIYWNTSKTINSYTESGFGTINLANGSYLFCAGIAAINFIDYNSGNDFACKLIYVGDNLSVPMLGNSTFNATENLSANISEDISENLSVNLSDNMSANYTSNMTINATVNVTINTTTNITVNMTANMTMNLTMNATANTTMNITFNETTNNETVNTTIPENSTINSTVNSSETDFNCNCKLKIETNKILFLSGERIEINIIGCENTFKFSVPVEYWVEDRNKIVKPKLSTLTKTTKYYTPIVEQQEKYFAVKAKYEVCEETSEQLVIFVSDEENKTTEFAIDSDSEEDGNILYVKLDGYKADTDKSLISMWLEKDNDKFSEITKAYINKKNSEFSFELPVPIDVESTGNYYVVAEGLGVKVKKEVKIIRMESESKTKTASTKSAQTTSTAKTVDEEIIGKINSFYTLKKIFDENITVYVNVENPDDKTLMIYSDENKYKFSNLSAKNAFNISISSEYETLLAELFWKDELVDSKELKLNLLLKKEENSVIENESLEENSTKLSASAKKTESDIQSKMAFVNFYGSINESKLYENQSNISFIERENKLTGRVVESPASVNFRKEHIYFVIPAIAVCLLVFSRKTRTFFLKKTKIFK